MREIALGICFLALAACARTLPEVKMYEGPAEAGREVRLEAGRVGGMLQIWKVDGKQPVGGLEGLDHQARAVYLLPGKHLVTVKFSEGRSFAFSREMWFVGEPGRSYFVMAESGGGNAILGSTTVRFWIQDGQGRRVGGIRGSADEPK